MADEITTSHPRDRIGQNPPRAVTAVLYSIVIHLHAGTWAASNPEIRPRDRRRVGGAMDAPNGWGLGPHVLGFQLSAERGTRQARIMLRPPRSCPAGRQKAAPKALPLWGRIKFKPAAMRGHSGLDNRQPLGRTRDRGPRLCKKRWRAGPGLPLQCPDLLSSTRRSRAVLPIQFALRKRQCGPMVPPPAWRSALSIKLRIASRRLTGSPATIRVSAPLASCHFKLRVPPCHPGSGWPSFSIMPRAMPTISTISRGAGVGAMDHRWRASEAGLVSPDSCGWPAQRPSQPERAGPLDATVSDANFPQKVLTVLQGADNDVRMFLWARYICG